MRGEGRLFNWDHPPYKEGQVQVFAPPPRIFIEPEAHRLMVALIELNAPSEISGLARVRRSADGLSYVITQVIYLGGVHNAGHTDITKEVEAFMDQMAAEDGNLADINCWWHSHGHGAVFFSGTDTGTIESKIFANFIIAVVGNSQREFRCAYYAYGHPTHPPLLFDDLPYPRFMAVPTENDYDHARSLIARYRHKPAISKVIADLSSLPKQPETVVEEAAAATDSWKRPVEGQPIPRFDQESNRWTRPKPTLPPVDRGDPPPGELITRRPHKPDYKALYPELSPREPFFDFKGLTDFSLVGMFMGLFETDPTTRTGSIIQRDDTEPAKADSPSAVASTAEKNGAELS